ncbi:hypothetical protein LTR78_008434 [Recurvomyces mirabilis]|uniref:2EXR domain-containing protein n=1 Tax=Recurvomyces mirabilis TaxID=574656 RepID=A0AAE0WGZ6_9PEZI|nr:hypothetical protein LTR78_008434 [Recurvomyces mirabilis]KAK5155422.1 hypothetical protein LTS14_005683 [Recurvomyces mirabilis]
MARRQQYVGKGAFPFEKLPAELRIRISEFYFETGEIIDIQRKRKITGHYTSAVKGPWKVRGYKHVEIKSRTPRGAPKRRAKAYLPQNGTALLRVSREILKDARPVLYGKTVFQCCFQKAFSMFMQGSARASDVLRPLIGSALRILANVPNKIVHIEVIWHDEHSCPDPKVTAQSIKDWLADAVQKSGPRSYSTVTEMFAHVVFDFDFVYAHDCGGRCSSMEAAAKADRKRVLLAATRKLIAETLDDDFVDGPLTPETLKAARIADRLLGI